MLQSFRFDVNEFMPRRIFDAITEIRVRQPEIIHAHALARRQRATLTRDGKLVILACDHPQRGITQSGNDPLVMGNRHEYLGRALRIITDPSLDGVMAPPDLIEELFIVDYLVQQGGGPSFLDDRVLVGCMQRGGVAGVVGEVNDRFSAYTAESIAAERLDAGKMMFRFIPEDEGTLLTIDYCARAVTELHRHNLFAFVEPLPQEKADGKYKVNASVPVLVKLVNVSAALGVSSQHTWLKIPYVAGYETVAVSTTLPILMLGGESAGDVGPTVRNFAVGLRAGANVRGAMIGRNILFPGQGDPLAAALAVNAVVHHSVNPDDALVQIESNEGRAMDALTRWIK
jgi:DhnA family fructose-bisphosphate aldolase class Ia